MLNMQYMCLKEISNARHTLKIYLARLVRSKNSVHNARTKKKCAQKIQCTMPALKKKTSWRKTFAFKNSPYKVSQFA